MEVILRDDVRHLGKAGELVKVRDGYARNFLIPQGLAYLATEGNKKRVTEEARRKDRNATRQRTDAEQLAGTLSEVSVTFTVKAGEGDRLFGSITSADIADKLAELGHKVDKRAVELDEPIKLIGIYKVPVRLHTDVRPEVRVWVVKE